MVYTKEEIVKEYKRLRMRVGKPPDSKTFFRESPVSRRAAELAFGSSAFSKIQKSAGDEPRGFGMAGRSEDQFFETFGQAVKNLQHLPTEADWNHLRIKPTPSGYRTKLGLVWSQLPHAFRDWAVDKPEWEDVIRICSASFPAAHSTSVNVPSVRCGYVYLLKSGRYYKIGRTNSPGRREYEVALQLPEKPKTVHLIETDDPVGVEAYWHNRFSEKRKRGEFFELSPEDVKAFKKWTSIW